MTTNPTIADAALPLATGGPSPFPALPREEHLAALGDLGIGHLVVDHEWRVVYANQHVLQFSDLPESQFIGSIVWEALPQVRGTIFEEQYRRAIAEQQASSFYVEHSPKGRSFEIQIYPMAGGLSIYSVDVTERDNALKALKQSEERVRIAIEAASLGPWEFNVQKQQVYWSPQLEQIHGLEPGVFGGKFEDYVHDIHPDDLQHVLNHIKDTLASGADHEMEYRIILPDGQIRWVLGKGKIFYDNEGRPKWMKGVCMDITERKETELQRDRLLKAEQLALDKAEEANRLKDEFLATLSHELRTPLNAILGWSQLMRVSENLSDEVVQGLAIIENNAIQQARLIEDLLDMNRVISGKLHIELANIDAAEIAADAIESVRPLTDGKNIVLKTAFPAMHSIINGDAHRLRQIYSNLLSNAIKFTPEGGVISIAIRSHDGVLEVEVNDTGDGIAPGFLPHLFERFRQADSSSSKPHSGLGLGLAIVKSLTELHGGTVSASSGGPGQGACFRVCLPLAPEEKMRTQSFVPPDAIQKLDRNALAGRKILAVEDQEDSRRLLVHVLERYGAEVRAATNGIEALKMVSEFAPDGIVSDIGMPGLDGYAMLEKVRAITRERPIATIALTAFARTEDAERAYAAGYQAHIAKPYEPVALVTKLVALFKRNTRV